MNCPHCKHALSPAEARAIWASYTASLRTRKAGGRKASCSCGTCRTCKQRERMRRKRSEKR